MNAIVVKTVTMRNEKDFETEQLLNQSLSFKTHKIYLTAIFTHVF